MGSRQVFSAHAAIVGGVILVIIGIEVFAKMYYCNRITLHGITFSKVEIFNIRRYQIGDFL